MDEFSTHRGRSPRDSGVVALRIMRFMPVTIPVPMRIEPKVNSGTLVVRPGVRVAVGGTITAEGFGARLTYRQRGSGTTPADEVTSERIALLHDRTLTLPPRAVDRPVAGRPPDLWIQFLDGGGTPVTGLTRLGRCDQGPFDLTPNLTLGISVDAAILRPERSDPYSMPMLALAGEICIRTGIVARFTLTENGGPAPRPGDPTTPADVSLFPGGTEVQLPRRMLHGPIGRDSWIYVTFLDGAGRPTGGESLLGKAEPGVVESSLVSPDGLLERRTHLDRGGR
ncbi:MAG: hypothetical protein E6K79_09455 [Candidatus Eisenbacteria bacterium]|uniref:Uncharacterized protein n=1 Tax=Eiseniibacteriota bacterium TaxID=2212470 RepID=A0A538TJR5_UNCEI|nr:MAG: hypothetical protein E6K79_09455 [Candidatus Eisenbacteria bacterium]